MQNQTPWKNRRVLVTGATGFVGSWLAQGLKDRGAHVVGLTRAGSTSAFCAKQLTQHGVALVVGSLDDVGQLQTILAENKIDTVFHLAANNINIGSSVSPIEIFRTNTAGTWNILEACRLCASVKSIVVASSTEAGGSTTPGPDGRPMRRKHHPYQVSKESAELVTQAYADTYDMPVVIAKTENIYGGRDFNWQRLIPGVIRSLSRGERPALRSDGKLVRHYLHIDDVVRAYASLGIAAERSDLRGSTFNFASPTGSPVIEIVTQLAGLMGRADLTPVLTGTATGERLTHSAPDDTTARALGWKSECTMADGLKKTVEWYQDYFGKSPEAATDA